MVKSCAKVTSNRQRCVIKFNIFFPPTDNTFVSVHFCYHGNHGQQLQAAQKARILHSHCALIILFSAYSHQLFHSFAIDYSTLHRLGVYNGPPLEGTVSRFGYSAIIIQGAFVLPPLLPSPLSPMLPRSSLSMVPKFAIVSQDIDFLTTCCLLKPWGSIHSWTPAFQDSFVP